MIYTGLRPPAGSGPRRSLRRQWWRESGIRFVTGLSRILGSCPRGLVLPLCAGLGVIGSVICAKDRRLIQAHLRLAFPGLDRVARERLLGRAFRAMALNAMDGMRFLHRPAPELRDLVEVRGAEHLTRAVRAGRGAVVVTGHLGPWELFAGYFALSVPLTVVARPAKDPRLEDLLAQLRARFGVRVARERDVRTLVTALRAGEVVGIVCDQARKSEGVWVPLFGHPAWMPVGPAKLARRTGAELIVGGMARVGWQRFVITLGEPLPDRGADPAGLRQSTAEIACNLESLVRENPAEWIWMYDHWRGPAGPVAKAEVTSGGEAAWSS